MADNRGTGKREAHIAALSFGLMFVCMLVLFAISDTVDQPTVATVAATSLPDIR